MGCWAEVGLAGHEFVLSFPDSYGYPTTAKMFLLGNSQEKVHPGT